MTLQRRATVLLALALVQGCAVEREQPIAIVTVPASIDSEQELLKAAARAFYATHDDAYDMLVIWPSRSLPGGSYYLPVANDILGIGYENVEPDGDTFDRAADYGSTRVDGIVRMGSAWPVMRATGGHDSLVGVLSQETGHRWGASIQYVGSDGQRRSSLVGAGGVHWSFLLASESSPLGGNNWSAVGDGRYRAVIGSLTYSQLDLYLMGLLPAAEVPPIQLLVDVTGCPAEQCANWGPTTTEIEVAASVESIAIDQIIAAEGPRVPSAADAPKEIRQAWIYVHTDAEEPDLDALEYLDEVRATWEQAFATSTGGRGTVRTSTLRE